jgi:hypothetical protein
MARITGRWNRQQVVLPALIAFIVLSAVPRLAGAQCVPVGCPAATCVVTTEAELLAAIECSSGCSHIVIPEGCTVDVDTTLYFDQDQAGRHFEIRGALRWNKQEVDPNDRIIRLDDISDITIDGGGTITSIYDAADYITVGGIAIAIGITGAPSGAVTISDLNVSNLTSILVVATGTRVDALTVTSVHGDELVQYGVFCNNKTTGVFRNCTVRNTYTQHGFRLYANGAEPPDPPTTGDLEVENCWAYHDREDKTGIWILEGDAARVDRFATNREILFGPDHSLTSPPSLTNVVARELNTTHQVAIAMGVDGACLVNLCTPVLRIGRIPSQVAHNLPLDRTNWDSVFWPSPAAQVIIAENDNIVCGPPHPECRVHAINYNYCFADIDRSEFVDSDDLTAIILAWGACPSPPPGYSAPYPPCPADIHPNICGNNAVDTDDLVEVILRWGACLDHPECGARPAKAAGSFSGSAPTTIQECYEQCIQKHPNDQQKFLECFNACRTALEILQ